MNLDALINIKLIKDKILTLINTDLTTLNSVVSYGSAKTIDIAHYKIHDGSSFLVNHSSASFSNNTYLDIQFTTTSKAAHLTFSFNAGGAMMAYLTEGATTTGGTPKTSYNLNRNSETVSTLTTVTNPTVTDQGTIIFQTYLPGGSGAGPTVVGAGAESRTEIILKLNTVYLLRLNNISGSARSGTINAMHYEV